MQNWKFALSSVLGHKMRSFLTMLGVIIGVASVSVILAIGTGMQKYVNDLGSQYQHDVQVYYVSKDAQLDEFGQSYSDDSQKGEPKIQEAWLETIVRNNSNISGYYVSNTTTANTVSYGKKKTKQVTLNGVSKNYFDVNKVKLKAGRRLEASDYTRFSRYIMIDEVLANHLFSSYEAALNNVIDVAGKQYRVIGVYKDPNAGSSTYGMISGGSALMSNTQLASEFGVDEVGSIYFHVPDALQSAKAGKDAAKELTKLSAARQGYYRTFDIEKALASMRSQATAITLFIGLVGGTSLLVGGIGVMNIMLVSVTERTREIGLRKALGATRRNILMQFLIESVVLTLIGGLIGVLLAYGLTGLLGPGIESAGLGRPAVSIKTVIVSLLFSVGVGMVFGILPANKASKLDPIEALRYE